MTTATMYRIAADLLLLLHAGVAAFVVLGLLLIMTGACLGWDWVRNPVFRGAHLAAIGFIVIQAWLGRVCPLTIWEMVLRERAGDAVYRGSFIAHWLETLLYYDAPPWVFALVYTVFGALVAGSWFLVPPGRRGRRE